MQRAVKIDFFNFTTRRTVAEVCAMFHSLKNPLTPQDRGLHGYNFSFTSSDGITVLYSVGRSDVHVQISGSGCDALGLVDLRPLDLLAAGDNVTRLDLAVDCIGSGFTCSDIWGLLRQGQFISVSSDIRQVEGLLSRESGTERVSRSTRFSEAKKTRSNSGHTIYVGSSSSDRMVRIYDKGAESGTGADWLRFEIQLRRESARQFCKLLVDGDLAELTLGMLNKQVKLLADGQESLVKNEHHSRAVLHPFWAKLTDLVEPLKLCIPKVAKTIASTIRYVKNVGPSIKALKGAMCDFDEFFAGVVDDAVLKLKHQVLQDEIASANVRYADECHSYHFHALQSLVTGPMMGHAF